MNTPLLLGGVIVLGAALVFALAKARAHRRLVLRAEIAVRCSPRAAYDLVRSYADFYRWSPFVAQDPALTYEVKGEDGAVGAEFHWLGRQGKDKGKQTLTALEAPSRIEMRCDIEKPFVAHPTFVYTFAPAPEGVRVAQVFTLESGLVDAFFLWVFRVRGQMVATNELGLSRLKDVLEKASG
jgi:hypothetical protein